MLKKFERFTDEMLVELLLCDDNDAQLELLERYRIYANEIGRRIYNQFKKSVNCDAEDLVLIALNCVFSAAKTYKKTGNFKVYWSCVAENEVMDYVKNNSDTFLAKNQYKFINYDELEDQYDYFSQKEEKVSTLYDALVEFVQSDSFDASQDSKDMFILFMNGYTFEEIALRYNLPRHKVRYQIRVIKDKVSKKLLHS